MSAPPRQEGLFGALRGSLATLLALAQVRVELLATELQEEKTRVGMILMFGAGAVFCLSFGLFFLAILITVLLWDSNRLLALGVFAAMFLTAGGIFAAIALRQARAGSKLFAASIGELQRDRAALRTTEPPAES